MGEKVIWGDLSMDSSVGAVATVAVTVATVVGVFAFTSTVNEFR